MAKVRQEDLQMKIPALLHLSRLGYGYLSKAQLLQRDRRTNFLPVALRAAVERINGVPLAPEEFVRLMEDLGAQLDAEDLGRQFYGTLRDGWHGLRLIDCAHPENNLFQSAAELACGNGSGSFRPDITLYINGLPLAMIEVKTRDRSRGLQTEYDRMQKRFRARGVRRYLQCTQVWAFSDNHADDPGRLLPMNGAYFTTVMSEDFPLYAVREKAPPVRLIPRNGEEERRIMEDSGFQAVPRTQAFRQSLSPEKPAHRMLAALFQPERFLFLLRYGIRYVQETDPDGTEFLARRMLTAGQLAMLRSLAGKAKRGYRNWTAPSRGAAGEAAANASLVALLQDLFPEAGLCWVSVDGTELRRDRTALQSCGISCAAPGEPAEARFVLIAADGDAVVRSGKAGNPVPSVRTVFILPPPALGYGRKASFPARLRKAFPDAVMVTRTTGTTPESGLSAVLLRMEVRRNRVE